MDCRELERRLEALLDGALTAAERAPCERHLASCARCARLLELAGAADSGAAEAPAGLLGSVLARTSGPACGRARERLCGLVDGTLAPAERGLLEAHLVGCRECRALAAVLAALPADLERLAEVRPRPGLVAGVLAATLPLGVRLRRWWSREWPRWVRRPRFAWEAAYVATLFLVLVFAVPGSRLEALPQTALTVARINPVAEIEAPAAALEERVTARLGSLWRQASARTAAAARALAAAAAELTRPTTSAIGDAVGTIRAWGASLVEEGDEDPPKTATEPTEETTR